MPKEAIPGRLGLLLTLFLCMINTLNSVARTSPQSGGNTSALMQWIMACLLFIIMAILEYSWILSHNKYFNLSNKSSSRARRSKSTKVNPSKQDEAEKKSREIYRRLDRMMLVLFPPTFLIFALIFWTLKDTR